VDSLLQACRSFHRALTESEVLQEAYRRTTAELSQRTGGSVSDFFGAEPPENHLDVLAEYIVNRAVKLPHYYFTAPLWNEHSEEFLRMRESAGVRPHWEATRRAGADWNATSRLCSRSPLSNPSAVDRMLDVISSPTKP